DGNRVYYRADPDCPILPELSSMLVKTAAVADVLREALTPLAKRIRLAFIHGSLAEGRERSGSDVDLIVVGDAPGGDLAVALRPLHEQLGREVNFSRYSPAESSEKLARRNHFLSSVLR